MIPFVYYLAGYRSCLSPMEWAVSLINI